MDEGASVGEGAGGSPKRVQLGKRDGLRSRGRREMMTVAELRLMLGECDGAEKVGYWDREGGYHVAETAEYPKDPHDPECDCGCVGIVLR